MICLEEYGVFAGFSRGAIACNYIGLYDEKIAEICAGSLPTTCRDSGEGKSKIKMK